MSASSFPDLAVGVLVSSLRLFSMTPHPPPRSSPTMPSSSRSEKLLRDALLRDERERQQLSSPPLSTRPPTHKRRHSHIPTSSYFKEEYAHGSFLFRTAMSNPRPPSPSSSSFSLGKEPERDRDHSPVSRTLFYGGDEEVINARAYQQQQQSTTSYRHPSSSPDTRRNRRRSPSTSPSPSPLRMKRRQENLAPNTHSTTNTTNDSNLRRNQSLQNTTPNPYGSAYPSPSHGQGEQVLRARLEGALTVDGSDARSTYITMRRRDDNEVRDEQGGVPWKRGRQAIRSGSGSIISGSFNTDITNSSSASNSNSSHSQFQSNYPHTPQNQIRTYNHTPNRATQNPTSNYQRSPYYSPASPHTPYPYFTPGVRAVSPDSMSWNRTRTRAQTDPKPPPKIPTVNSPRRNNSSPTTTSFLPVAPSPSRSGKLMGSNSKQTKKSPLPLLLGDVVVGKVEEELRLPTPPPSPPFVAHASYVPSPYKTATANPSPNGTPTKIPVRSQFQRKKEGGLEMRIPTQGPAAAVAGKKEPLRPLDLSLRQRQRDATITQQSQQALRLPISPNNNADGHSLASSESCSTGTSAFSASHLHVGSASGYSACSSHSSLDGPIAHFPDSPHLVQQSQSIPPTPTTPFNARKASTQCRAMQGYVSFANVEGLGEPPLVGEDFDGGEEGRKGNVGKGRKGSLPFLPLGVLNAALGWKKFLGGAGAGPGIGHGGEGQGVVV